MAQPQGLSTDREAHMVEAHHLARVEAAEVFAEACRMAMDRWDDPEVQFAYLAGFFAELRRLTTQKQNQGFRKCVAFKK
jgi:hypothetical protein